MDVHEKTARDGVLQPAGLVGDLRAPRRRYLHALGTQETHLPGVLKKRCALSKSEINKVSDIDFVIAWVDDSDIEWRRLRDKYKTTECGYEDDSGEERYRDWGLLPYLFRSIDTFAPWVRKVFFVTCGQIPSWMDTQCEKLVCVSHEDFIPKQYLPTFSSHVIELNLHRIEGLSNQFVYFNDDTLLNHGVKPEDFFVGRTPRDLAALNVHCPALSQPIQFIAARDAGVINDHFSFRDSLRGNWKKWLWPGYGSKLLRTLTLLACPRFPGFYMHHCAQVMLKSTLAAVWDAEPSILDETCGHKFRECTDVNQWVVKEWQLAKGEFIPQAASFYRPIHIEERNCKQSVKAVVDEVESGKSGLICVNDAGVSPADFPWCRDEILKAYQRRLPTKSRFEL